MALTATNKSDFEFELIPAENHITRCYMVCDLGYQEEEYQGLKSVRRKVRIAFECPNALMQEGENVGKPFSISRTYTLSLDDRAVLCQHLESWRGIAFTEKEKRGFDILTLLNVPALVNVIHKVSKTSGNIYPILQSISKMPKGMTCPKLYNEPVSFSLEEDNWEDLYKELPEWLQKKINTDIPDAVEPQEQRQPGEEEDMDIDYDAINDRIDEAVKEMNEEKQDT
jgi:hypothetical protein